MHLIKCNNSNKHFCKFNREPLAKAFSRHYELPKHVSDPNFAYGNETAFNDYVAKDVIAPNDFPIENDKDIKKLYIKTHGNYECGQ